MKYFAIDAVRNEKENLNEKNKKDISTLENIIW